MIYDKMVVNLKKTKERETLYKEQVDNANSFLMEFKKQMNDLCA